MQGVGVDKAVIATDDRLVQLGEAIREALGTADVTQQALADQIGVNNAQVSRLVGGKVKNVSLEQVRKIEDALGCFRGELLIRAGYVALPSTTRDYLVVDDALSDSQRRALVEMYDAFSSPGHRGGRHARP